MEFIGPLFLIYFKTIPICVISHGINIAFIFYLRIIECITTVSSNYNRASVYVCLYVVMLTFSS